MKECFTVVDLPVPSNHQSSSFIIGERIAESDVHHITQQVAFVLVHSLKEANRSGRIPSNSRRNSLFLFLFLLLLHYSVFHTCLFHPTILFVANSGGRLVNCTKNHRTHTCKTKRMAAATEENPNAPWSYVKFDTSIVSITSR
jgi:hypothetical protein